MEVLVTDAVALLRIGLAAGLALVGYTILDWLREKLEITIGLIL